MIRLDTDCTMVVKTDAPIKLTSVESEIESTQPHSSHWTGELKDGQLLRYSSVIPQSFPTKPWIGQLLLYLPHLSTCVDESAATWAAPQ